VNHFRGGSTRIQKNSSPKPSPPKSKLLRTHKTNSPDQRSHLKEQTPGKKHQQIILIQIRGSRHQSENEKNVA